MVSNDFKQTGYAFFNPEMYSWDNQLDYALSQTEFVFYNMFMPSTEEFDRGPADLNDFSFLLEYNTSDEMEEQFDLDIDVNKYQINSSSVEPVNSNDAFNVSNINDEMLWSPLLTVYYDQFAPCYIVAYTYTSYFYTGIRLRSKKYFPDDFGSDTTTLGELSTHNLTKVSGRIEPGGDDDWFRLILNANTYYIVTLFTGVIVEDNYNVFGSLQC